MISNDMATVLLFYGIGIILLICGINESDNKYGASGFLFTMAAVSALVATIGLLTIGN